jgi:pantothenate kinase
VLRALARVREGGEIDARAREIEQRVSARDLERGRRAQTRPDWHVARDQQLGTHHAAASRGLRDS